MLQQYLSVHITLSVTVNEFDINQRHTVSHWHPYKQLGVGDSAKK